MARMTSAACHFFRNSNTKKISKIQHAYVDRIRVTEQYMYYFIKKAKNRQKMPNLSNLQYGTHFEEDNVPSENLPFFFNFGLSVS